jgi:hypothetical protein
MLLCGACNTPSVDWSFQSSSANGYIVSPTARTEELSTVRALILEVSGGSKAYENCMLANP